MKEFLPNPPEQLLAAKWLGCAPGWACSGESSAIPMLFPQLELKQGVPMVCE